MNALDRHPYVTSSLLIAIVTSIAFATFPFLHAANLDTLYMLAVLVAALRWGERPAIYTAVVGALVFDYCFVAPRFSFAITDLAYVVTFGGFVAIAIVTARLAAHANALVREQAERERLEALAGAKDLVLHKISHELRTPLTAVIGWMQMMRSAEMDTDDFDRALSGLENSTAVLRRLVNDLWDASRAASGKLAVQLVPIELRPCIAKALDIVVRPAHTKRIQLASDLQPAVRILGDEMRIEQIVTNLVSNAIKFTPPEGTVTVKLSRDAGNAELVVSDTGPGIAGEFLPRVFDPFTQGDPRNARGGMGLGLSIVKYLVEAHHGTIAVASGEGRGTTFTVRLPLIEPATSEASHPDDFLRRPAEVA